MSTSEKKESAITNPWQHGGSRPTSVGGFNVSRVREEISKRLRNRSNNQSDAPAEGNGQLRVCDIAVPEGVDTTGEAM